jgi:hypothetical protein
MKINGVWQCRKAIFGTAAVILLLAIAFAVGRWSANRPASVEKELSHAQNRLTHLLINEGDFAQVHLTTVSAYIRQLADMELYWTNLRIWNQPGYGKIEAEYRKDEELWEKRLEDEVNQPSDFEGGTMAPMDLNLRMATLINERIDEIRKKWLK